MGFSTTVRKGVALAQKLTSDLQVDVQHEAWTGSDDYSKPTYDTAVLRSCLLELEPEQVRPQDRPGEVLRSAKLTFLEPIDPHGATGREEPIDPRDRFTLPSGWTAPILEVKGLADPATENPYLYEVTIGQ